MKEWWQDFAAFRKFITPQVMPIVFWVGVAITVIMGLITIAEGGSAGRIFEGLVMLFFGPLFVRILCELVLTFFRPEK